jgi:hypothetical protein
MTTFQLPKETIQNLIDSLIEDDNKETLLADGLEDAIIGIGSRCSKPPLVCYNVAKIIEILMDRDGMTYEEAREFYEFNIVGAWMGEGTPIFVEIPEE